ncbi:MAG: alpha/beta hydrolase [Pseudomonadota bacterium]
MIFVLVHGGWHGGWCWRPVAERLKAAGHQVFAPTLTGLGERQHLLHAVESPETHVADIVNLIRWNDLSDIVLVGHSYGGMIITGTASALAERIRALVYLDAFVPTESGQAASDMAPPGRAAEIAAAIQPDGTITPNGFERWAASPERIAWLRRMCTPHPAACFGKGVALSGREREVASRSFILCEAHNPSPFWQFYERYVDDPGWQVHRLPCLHDAMLEMPEELTALLLRSAA